MKRALSNVWACLIFVAGLFLVWGEGCSATARTDIDPSTSRVASKTEERRPTKTETTSLTVTTPAAPPPVYIIRIEEPPCSKPPASPSPSPSAPPETVPPKSPS